MLSTRVGGPPETRRGREGVLSEARSRSVLRFGVAMMLPMIAMRRSARLNLCPENADRAFRRRARDTHAKKKAVGG